MAFDLNFWKQQLREKLKGWKPRMQQAGATSVYAFLSAASLIPVLEAARNGEFAAFAALGALVGNVGTNLLANMIQVWKDESDAARKLEAELQQNESLHQELDLILEKLETLPVAGEDLSTGDKEWFAATLHAELSRLNSSIQINKRAVYIGRDAKGNIIVTGENNKIEIKEFIYIEKIEIYNGPDPRRLEKEKAADARKRYLEALKRKCLYLPLTTLGGTPGMEEDITLDKVYISLNTTTHMMTKEDENEQRRGSFTLDRGKLPALDAVRQNPKVVLLGDPGSGKSTFARKLLALQAEAALGGAVIEGIPSDLIPVMVVLRDLAGKVDEKALEKLPEEQRRIRYSEALLSQILYDLDTVYHVPEFAEEMKKLVYTGQILLVLDGLDEVRESLRRQAHQLVWSVCRECHPQRVLVTCRIRSYVEETVLPDFPAFVLAELSDGKIKDFCEAWYESQKHRLGDAEVKVLIDSLIKAISNDEEINELARNPMLLTIIANIHQEGKKLPNQRVQLFKRAVEILLIRWQEGRTEIVDEKLRDLLKSPTTIRKSMERLAFEAQLRSGRKKKLADLPRKDALDILERENFFEIGMAGLFLDYINQRAGLLVGRGGDLKHPEIYSFPHRTFQEYLAGCYLFAGRPREVFDRLKPLAGKDETWTLAVLLGAEEKLFNGTSGDDKNLLDLLYKLLPIDRPGTEAEKRMSLWAGNIMLKLEPSVIAQDGMEGEKFLQNTPKAMLTILSSQLTAPERVDAGNVLSAVGDPRFDKDFYYLPREELRGFVLIPAGPFWMGSDQKDDPQAYDVESPKHQVALPDYYIQRYPVTAAQYRHFVERSNHKTSDEDSLKGPANHPVVWVSWYDALAYADWLTEEMKKNPRTPQELQKRLQAGWRISLPSEAEWEKAARGTDGRIYPWEGEFDPNRTNCAETGLGRTSAVGCFPGGRSPYGILDLSGNVWEWTRSKYEKYKYVPGDGREVIDRSGAARVLRGGSFYLSRGGVRCASRDGGRPGLGGDDGGVRLVLSPFTS